MVEAPEKIWAYANFDGVVTDHLWTDTPDSGTEYLRSDIAERQIAELRAEVAEHKRLKNQLVLKAYPAMDAIDEIADGFRSAVHFVRNNAMNMGRDYPEICRAEEVFNRARAALSGSGAGGWRAMDSAPKDQALWLAWDPEDWTCGEGRMVDGGWIACGSFYDAKRSPPYRYGEAKVEPVLWMPLLDHLILLAKSVEDRR